MRLQKYLASSGVASRRKCEEYIQEGRISVNGNTITQLGTQVSDEDIVTYDHQIVRCNAQYVYYILNKPVGYVTTVKDEKDRPTVLDLMREIPTRIFPVGRLDYNTSGLLMLTNDGELTYALTHPKHDVNKTYQVKVKGRVSDAAIENLESGIFIEGRKTAPARVDIIQINDVTTTLSIIIHEGRNRQIRKMCDAIEHEVLRLSRTAIGDMRLEGLSPGKYRKLTEREIVYLKKIGGIDV